MARPREFKETAVLDATTRAFWHQGFGATSVRDLEKDTGLGAASLYNAFGDKRALFLQALENYAATVVRPRLRRLGALPPIDRIEAFVGEVATALSAPDGPSSCLVVNSTMELAAQDPVLRQVLAGYVGEVEGFLQDALADAVQTTVLPPGFPAKSTASGLMTMLLGLHVQARLSPERERLLQSALPLLTFLRQAASPNQEPASLR